MASPFFDTNVLLRTFSFYDAVVVASALAVNCDTLYSEDMQHGRRVEGTVVIGNPFAE